MPKTLRVVVPVILMAGALAACQPTGSPRCDAYVGPQIHIEHINGWTLDCSPPFDGTNDGTQQGVLGWASKKDRTVYIWPDRIRTDKSLHKILWHEAGHTWGLDERQSELFAWCHMLPDERDGIGWFLPSWPTARDCATVPA